MVLSFRGTFDAASHGNLVAGDACRYRGHLALLRASSRPERLRGAATRSWRQGNVCFHDAPRNAGPNLPSGCPTVPSTPGVRSISQTALAHCFKRRVKSPIGKDTARRGHSAGASEEAARDLIMAAPVTKLDLRLACLSASRSTDLSVASRHRVGQSHTFCSS